MEGLESAEEAPGLAQRSVCDLTHGLLNSSERVRTTELKRAFGVAAGPRGPSGTGHRTTEYQPTMLLGCQIRGLGRVTVEDRHAGRAAVGTGNAVFV